MDTAHPAPSENLRWQQRLPHLVPVIIVWTTWAAMLAAALWFVNACGRSVPLGDEWDFMPVLAGAEPFSANWLWSQLNEHRIPLPKLLLVGLLKATGDDFRSGMYFTVFGLAGLAALLILATRRLRGWTAWQDAFFPLLLLHWGQCENFLMCLQVLFLLSTTLAIAGLVIIARVKGKLTSGGLMAMAGCLMLLPMTGAMGYILVPPLALWLAYAVLQAWQSDPYPGRPGRLMSLGILVAAMAPSALYWIGYSAVAHHPRSPNLRAALQTFLECLGMSFGPLEGSWPVGALLMVALNLWAAFILLGVWRRQPEQRCRALGLLVFLIAILGISLAIGWGRAGLGRGSGLMSRYVTLVAPGLCCIYLVFVIYGDRIWTGWVQGGLLTVFVLSMLYNMPVVLHFSSDRRQMTETFQSDVQAGLPPVLIAAHFSGSPYVLYPDQDKLHDYLSMAQRAGLSFVRGMTADPAYRLAPLTKTGAETRPDNLVVLKKLAFIYAVRVQVSVRRYSRSFATIALSWRTPGRDGKPIEDKSTVAPLLLIPGEKTLVFWVDENVSQFRIDPGQHAELVQVREIQLLLPDSETEGAAP